MRFGTLPHPIPNMSSHDGRIARDIGCVFDVGNLDLLNSRITVRLVPIPHDIIWLDIRMHNVFLV